MVNAAHGRDSYADTNGTNPRTSQVHRIARTSFRHPRLVLALWLLALVAAITVGPALVGDYANTGRLPHTDSQAAYDSLARDFPQRHGDEARIVVADITKNRPVVDAYLQKVAHAEGVLSVQPPVVSPGGHVAIVPVTTANGANDTPSRSRPGSRIWPRRCATRASKSSSRAPGSVTRQCPRASSSGSSSRSWCCSWRSAR